MGHASISAALGGLADGAGVQDDNVCIVRLRSDRVARGNRPPRDILRVGFIHLTAERFDVDSRHGSGPSFVASHGFPLAELLEPATQR
jgi:hypothetical protein